MAKGGWFTELGSLWPGQGLSLEVKDVLFKDKSKFQVGNQIVWVRLLLGDLSFSDSSFVDREATAGGIELVGTISSSLHCNCGCQICS